MEQQPRDPLRCCARDRESALWTPTTSCPASTARAAATAESTPPDSAARTFMFPPQGRSPAVGEPCPADHGADRVGERRDIGAGRTPPQTTTQSAAAPVSYTHLRAHETKANLVC